MTMLIQTWLSWWCWQWQNDYLSVAKSTH
jgi:hypothetical protein